MGSEIGVYTDKEVEGLSKKDIDLLRRHVIHHIQTSSEIRQILDKDWKLLKKVTTHPRVNKILRKEAAMMRDRLKKK